MSSNEADEDVHEDRSPTEKMPLEEKIRLWRNRVTDDTILEPDLETNLNVSEDDGLIEVLDEFQDFEMYARLVSCQPSYGWLLSKLQSKMTLTDTDFGTIAIVREEVLQRFPNIRQVRLSTQSLRFRALFHVKWPLRAFLKDQRLSDSCSRSIAYIITLTGTVSNAQALTCEEYMNMVWPTTGIHLIKLIEEVIELSQISSCHRPDGASMTAETQESTLMVTVTGTKGVIAEVAEQLAWLGAALRTSAPNRGLSYCDPSIRFVGRDKANGATRPSEFSQTNNATEKEDRSAAIDDYARSYVHKFTISFTCEDAQEDIDVPGSCWCPMFGNPVMVRGFPIRQRPRHDLGLEIPLNIMGSLVCTSFVNMFYDDIYLKGFSAMLVATEQFENIVLWHLHCNRAGDHVPYLGEGAATLSPTTVVNLGKFRHVIGWCTNVLHRDISAIRACKVLRSRLQRVHAGAALEKCSISLSKVIDGGKPFVVLKKDQTIHVSRHHYHKKLAYLAENFVLFWDTKESKGWLVNGVTALLQLVVVSLQTDQDGPFSSYFHLEWSKLNEAAAPHTVTRNAALEILKSMSNLKLTVTKQEPLSESETSEQAQDGIAETFAHRVQEFYHALEKMLRYQEDVEHHDRLKTLRRPRSQLEGWDFVDLASQRDPIRPFCTTLPTVGKSWIDFLRSISVVTIFGQEFGELLRPNGAACCPAWKVVPSKRFYVAVEMADIRKIVEVHGDPQSVPKRLSNNTLWHSRGPIFKSRNCEGKNDLHTDIVQVTWPLHLAGSLPNTCHPNDQDLNFNGAVVFGYNDTFQWHWKDNGDPSPGQAPNAVDELKTSIHDSGYGSSLDFASGKTDMLADTSRSSRQALDSDSMMILGHTGNTFGSSSNYGGSHHFGDRYITNHYYPSQAAVGSITNLVELFSPWHWASLPFESTINNASQPSDEVRSTVYSVANHEQQRPSKRQRLSTKFLAKPSIYDRLDLQVEQSVTFQDASDQSHHEQSKRCCRCQTAMNVIKPASECSNCVHEFCALCGVQPSQERLITNKDNVARQSSLECREGCA